MLDVCLDLARFVEFVGCVAGADEEGFLELACFFVFDIDVERLWGGGDFDFADVLAIDAVEADGEECGGGFAKFFEEEIVHEPEFEAIAVFFLEGLVVVVEAEGGAVVGDADEEGAAVGVEEGCDGFEDDFFHGAVFFVFVQVPAGGGFEFEGVGFALLDELGDFEVAGEGLEVFVGLEGGVFGGLGDDGEGAEDVGEFGFGEAVEVGNDAVELGAELGALGFVGGSVVVAAEADFCGEVVEFWGGADEFGGAVYDVGEVAIAFH